MPARHGVRGDDLAVARQRVVVGQAQDPRRRRPHAAWTSSSGATTPSERVVCVCRSTVDGAGGTTRPTSARLAAGRAAVVGACPTPVTPRQALDPFDLERAAGGGIDVDLDGVEHDRPLAHLEAGRQGVDEARDDGPRREPDHAPDRAGHPDVGLVGRAVGEDPLVAGHDVGVRPDHDAHPAVEVQPERVLLGRQLAVEVDEADRRQRLGGLVEQPVGVGERVLDLLHVRAALEVDDRDIGAVERAVHAPAATGDLVRAVVERPQDAIVGLEERVDLALVPDVVAAT